VNQAFARLVLGIIIFLAAAYLDTIYNGSFIIWIIIGVIAGYIAMYMYPKLHEHLYNWIYQ
jgi:hypothetical protein